MRRRTIAAAVLAVVVLACATAVAFWTTSGAGSAAASVGTLSAPSVSVPATSTGAVAVSWTASHPTPSTPALDAQVTYLVQRSADGGTTWMATGGTCGTVSAPTVTCSDSVATSGTYLYRVTARFHSWTAGGTSGSVAVNALTAPPITARPSTPSASSAPAFSFSGGNGTGYECKLDAGAFGACTSPKSYSSVANGSHTFTVRATDGAFSGPPTAYTWTIDASGPVIGAKPSNPSANSATATIAFTHATYASFKCKLDAGSFTTCSSPASLFALNGNASLADGSHTFTVEAIDADGVVTTTSASTWTVTTTAPTIGARPANPSANAATATIAFTHASYSSFKCKLDAGSFIACTSPANLKTLNGNVNLADGSHSFNVRAVDADGVTTAVATYTWTVTTTAPAIGAKPSNPSANSATATIAFTHATYPSFKCKLDAGAFTTCTSPADLKTLNGNVNLADGSHTFTVEAVDADGLATTTAAYTWTVTTTAPAIGAKPSNPSANNAAATIAFTHATYASFQCKLDAAGFTACTSAANLKLLNGNVNLADGSHTFSVQALDADGAITAVASYTWTVNTAAPTIGARPSSPSANNATATIAFMHAAHGVFKCKLDAGAFTACTSAANLKTLNGNVNLADGSHTFTVEAVDADGFVTLTSAYAWTVTSTAPVIGGKPPNPSANNATATIAFTHASYASFQCKLDAGSFTACTSAANLTTLNGNVNLPDGSHTFTVQALDADGVATLTSAYTWTVNTAAPTITSNPTNPSSSTSATFTFTHGAYASFECKLDAGAFAACNTGTVTYTGLSLGGHTFTVRALDAASAPTSTATYVWTIATAPVVAISSCTGGNGHRNAVAGTSTVNTGTVTVKILAGIGTGGALAATISTSTFAGSSPAFTWTATTANNQLTTGSTYTAQATQVDAGGNTSNQPTCTFSAN